MICQKELKNYNMNKSFITYKEKNFDLPDIDGISKKQFEVHLKLYAGYVSHTNKINKIMMTADAEENSYTVSEVFRRFGFEFNGMRNHEHYFGALEGAQTQLKNCKLKELIEKKFSSVDNCMSVIKNIAKNMRGSGWIMMHYDKQNNDIVFNWVTNHEQGQLTSLQPLIAVDMWEHAYMVDYLPADKLEYVSSYLKAINWEVISEKFESYIK